VYGVEHELAPVVLHQAVLPVPQEREVVVGQPAQQFDRVGDVPARYRQVRAAQLVGQGQGLGAHLRPVLHGGAHVGEDPRHVVAHLPELPLRQDPVDLHPHPALDDVVRSGVLGLYVRPRLPQGAQAVAAHHHDRMYQQVDLQVPGGQRAGDRVHEERHVVGDDLQHGVVVLRAAGGAQPRLAGHPALAEVPKGARRGDKLLRGAPNEFLVGHDAPA
jgi:hypothetical protein